MVGIRGRTEIAPTVDAAVAAEEGKVVEEARTRVKRARSE